MTAEKHKILHTYKQKELPMKCQQFFFVYKKPTLRQSKAQRGCEDSLCYCVNRSAGKRILVQSLAHSAGACKQLLGHCLDLLAQTNGIQIHAEHVNTAVQLL